MSSLSKREAANITMSVLKAGSAAYINIPDEYINYAAAVGLYVTRNWPGDDAIWYIPSAKARGPEMANAIATYTNLASKTLSFRFTRMGTWSLTADDTVADQGQDYLNQQSGLPPPGAVAQYQGYRYIDNGAVGNGSAFAAFNSFRQLSGPAFIQQHQGTSIVLQVVTGEYIAVNSDFAFEVADVNKVASFHITYSFFDDWTALMVNGRFVRAFNGSANQSSAGPNSTRMVVVNGGSAVDIGTGVYPISSGVQVFDGYYSIDMRPLLVNGTNIVTFMYINGVDRSLGQMNIDLSEYASGPTLGPVTPDAPGYSAVISGTASRNGLMNLLYNLMNKLYTNMVSNVYQINYCHTNCHNNCHSSRGRR